VVVRAARVAARVTRHTDKVDVAGIVFQLSCPFPKPGFWARNHPGFITRRRPDVTVRIDYEERDGRHGWRSVGDTVADAATVSRRGRNLRVSTGYYRAAVDLPSGRVTVKMAAGFDVAGLMRTLTALWLAERETLLVQAACFGPTESATLACGLPAWAIPSSATAGWFAVRPRADRVDVLATPFLVGDYPPPANGWCATTLALPGGKEPMSAPEALRALLPSIWHADRRRPAVERTLDLATRVVAALHCRELDATDPATEGVAVG
jgi:hypothetical protein